MNESQIINGCTEGEKVTKRRKNFGRRAAGGGRRGRDVLRREALNLKGISTRSITRTAKHNYRLANVISALRWPACPSSRSLFRRNPFIY